ncbi:uncharacterized protein LOC130137756 [Syzygium oleosum]|uniref:uncharacterized protein LOC130137756 n=1 Tax=Syzygium oleosum TaxID=219896 RepID=UPI0024B8FC81|nr:uncharacterized protein LOC130137756 [Syzygium oleosum]
MLKQKVKSLQAQASALAAELATLEMETIDLSNENAELKELHKAMVNRLHQQDARNEKIKLEIQWLKQMTSNPPMASKPFPFNRGNAADLLPNLQGHKHSAEAPPRLAEASSSAAGGDDALPRSIGDDDHSLDDPSGNNGLIEGSGKPADPTPTD